MILACGQTSPAAASNSLHFYDRVLRKIKQQVTFWGNFNCVACLEGLCFNSCAFLSIVWEGVRQLVSILPVQTRLTAGCLRGGASAYIFFKPETRLNGDRLSGVRQLASVVEPE